MNNAVLSDINRRRVFSHAWPIMLANISVPLLGLVDTAVIGHVAGVVELGAIALGSLVFSFVYWGFGFLRMGTTGFIAQAVGAGDEHEVLATTVRGFLLAVFLACLIMLFQWPIALLAFSSLQASDAVEALSENYFSIRIWGAPATLSLFVLMGVLIGLGKSRLLLLLQLFLNSINAVLDVYFAAFLQLGVTGIALGTVLAEWLACGFGCWLVWRCLAQRRSECNTVLNWLKIFNKTSIRQLLSVNTDIMIRTLVLLFSFAWFINQSAQFGDVVLAANHVLLQLISFSAFFLDGYAFVVEALVGKAIGAKSYQQYRKAIRYSSELAAATAIILALLIISLGELMIMNLSSSAEVLEVSRPVLPIVALYVGCAFAAFQLDGIFIGASGTKAMRNASLLATVVFICLAVLLAKAAGNLGLWFAFVAYVLMRALALGWYLPHLWPEATDVNSTHR